MPSDRETLQRQWKMLRLIPRHPAKITAKLLTEKLEAENFAVTKRTVERDLQTLSENFPLLADERDKPYGWSWQPNAKSFDVPGMSNAEALTFRMVELHLKPLMPASTLALLNPYFGTAQHRLDQAGDNPAHAWLDKVRVAQPTQTLHAPVVVPAAQEKVYEALLHERQLQIAYQKRGEADLVDYRVHLLGIVPRGQVIYLVCTLFDFQDVRLLALHRVRSAEMLEAPTRVPEGFSLDTYLASGAMGFGGNETIILEVVFRDNAGDHLHETPLSPEQVLSPLPDGSLKLKANVVHTEQLRWWLLGFGDKVEVIKPKALRQELARIAAALHATYNGGSVQSVP